MLFEKIKALYQYNSEKDPIYFLIPENSLNGYPDSASSSEIPSQHSCQWTDSFVCITVEVTVPDSHRISRLI